MIVTGRPGPDEFSGFNAGYVALVPEDDVLGALASQLDDVRRAADALRARETFRYAPGKWSVREVFGHLIDGERVFAYRAICIARGEQAGLPGFDENAYVAQSGADAQPLADLLDELVLTRQSTVAGLRRLDAAAWARRGTANGNPVSVRGLAFIMAGHVRHHLKILAERYR
jgi:hypothetical protein